MRCPFCFLIAAGLILTAVPAAPAQSFDDCGEISISEDGCTVLITDAGNYELSEEGGFSVGDQVRVIGQLSLNCFDECIDNIGCIQVSSIGPCTVDYTTCGEIVFVNACLLLQTENGFLYGLDPIGNLQVGDLVVVSGQFESNCPTGCDNGGGCILAADIQVLESGQTCENANTNGNGNSNSGHNTNDNGNLNTNGSGPPTPACGGTAIVMLAFGTIGLIATRPKA